MGKLLFLLAFFGVAIFLYIRRVRLNKHLATSPRIRDAKAEVLPNQVEIINHTLERIRALFPIEFKSVTDLHTRIYWCDTVCPKDEKGRTAVIYNGKCHHGLTFVDEIFVAKRETAGMSALVHELGHCIRLRAGLPGDRDHSDAAFWEAIRTIKDEVRAKGW